MRGWTHFLSGLAMASFFPELLADLKMGILWPVLTGVFGYLPDFIDFKFRRFLWRRDYEIDPAPWDPETKIAPMKLKIKDLTEDKRWQLYSIEGYVTSIVEESSEKLVFKLRDDTGEIRVEAIKEDLARLKKAYKEIKPGMKIEIMGFLDIDSFGKKFVVADAPHPQLIASMIAKAIDEAYETGKLITVKVYNIRMAADVYRRFLIHYDTATRTIKVYMGPLVTTGGLPIRGTETPEYRKVGEANTKYPFIKVYPRPTVIDAFNGPEIGYKRIVLPDGREVVEERFIPWHRGFSHSFTAGALAALILYPILLLLGYPHAIQLAIAAMLGYWMHVIEDQLGFMGSNLFPPITRDRIPGLMIGPNIYTGMNFATSWAMIALIIWNINRFTIPRPIPLPDIYLLPLLLIPTIIIYGYGIVDSISFRRLYKKYWKYYAAMEALEEREEIGGL